eukprot:SAG22_NODE_150_length_17426_cov_8.082588_7_plen_116_part_00
MQDVAGIMIDGGASIDIVGNLIEGNGGPGIILSAGIWGAPTGITVQSNYCEAEPIDIHRFRRNLFWCPQRAVRYRSDSERVCVATDEANNLYPVYLETGDGPMVACTDLLLLGMP